MMKGIVYVITDDWAFEDADEAFPPHTEDEDDGAA
jgi:hypothetical protein